MPQYPNYLNTSFQPQTNYPQYGYQPMQMDRMAQLQQFPLLTTDRLTAVLFALTDNLIKAAASIWVLPLSVYS